MTATRSELRGLEGRQVCVTRSDGTQLDVCSLVSAGRASVGTLWLFADGADTFIPLEDVLDIRASAPSYPASLAATLPGSSTTYRGVSQDAACEVRGPTR